MDVLRGPFAPNPSSALQSPPPRRISTVAGRRLSAVVSDRASTQSMSSPSPRVVSRWSDSTHMARTIPRTSRDSMPPPYLLHSDPLEGDKLVPIGPVVRQRGGCKRIGFLVLLALVAIALGIGLGVGLTRGSGGGGGGNGASTAEPDASTPSQLTYPVGEYSLVTALRTIETNCTSDPNTWRCFPGPTFAQSASASLATFNWLLSNTSASYATNSSALSTSSQGIAANLTISASNNPFSITFDSTPLTFINDTSPRYTFAANISQKIIPASNITADNRATVCFFNQTQVVGTLHLDDTYAQQYTFTGNNASYTLWPYAVQVELVSPGGQNTPACYYTTNGAIGAQITDVFTAQPAEDVCLCEYRNYF
ncbi:hypothetical protein M436DRAFT_58504 [Aureobasidium namibiae CBS 147.97]|uniref:Uncharacterized protein n=1 Tax=Aureobasidium namibiae CBS 147.97 TaxID=1043004 RepID=A0A074X1B3_9PEZI